MSAESADENPTREHCLHNADSFLTTAFDRSIHKTSLKNILCYYLEIQFTAHIEHVRSVAGVEHVGLGAGYDGINM